ncbi:hypothetical protein PS420_04040 [Pediococcus acidilactici]
MEVYKENIKRLKAFYKSDYFEWLEKNDPAYVSRVIEVLDLDPDNCDLSLYRNLSAKYGMPQYKYNLLDSVGHQKIKLSADIICGWKQLKKYLHPTFDEWIVDYASIRGTLGLHFIWPQHKISTINTLRYTMYNDRLDYLLYDLKFYFSGVSTPMESAYLNNTTKVWLTKFNNNFANFIEKMQLEPFVNDNYDVLDIEYGQQKIVSGGLDELRKHSRNPESMKKYFEQLLILTKKGNF